MFSEDRPVGNPAQIFRSFVKNKGLRNTPQRQQIMEVFFNESGHLTTEEIYDRVRKEDPSLGQATVYRTMKLLCEAGLAREVRFGDGLARLAASQAAALGASITDPPPTPTTIILFVKTAGATSKSSTRR